MQRVSTSLNHNILNENRRLSISFSIALSPSKLQDVSQTILTKNVKKFEIPNYEQAKKFSDCEMASASNNLEKAYTPSYREESKPI